MFQARASRVIESRKITTSWPILDHPLGLLDHHFGDLDVPGGRLVERAADDFAVRAFDLPLHVGHFFRPLVDQAA